MKLEYSMCDISIREATTKKDLKDLVRFGNQLYNDCPYFVPDLEQSELAIFDPKQNTALAYSEIHPLLALRGGEVVGRIVPFINHHSNEQWKSKDVRFMMFDFIDDRKVSAALLQAAAQWGRGRGMATIKGPLGFTDMDKEGMLVEDFDMPGTINTLYNYDYYPRHIEAEGYSKAADWIQIQLSIPDELPERYRKTADLCRKLFHLEVTTMTRDNILRHGYGRKFFRLINKSFSHLYGYTQIDEEQVDRLARTYVRLVDLRMVPIVENLEGEIVAAGVCIASLTEAFRKMGGHLLPLGWWHLLRALGSHHSSKAELLLIGVDPDYQGSGVNALLFEHLFRVFHELGYTEAETGPQLENNVKELSQWTPLNPRRVKRRRCYCKQL